MATVLTIDTGDFDSSSYFDQNGHNQGNSNEIFTKRFTGSGTLSDGSYCSFSFELTKSSSAPGPDITDETATYTVTIDKS